MVEAKGKGIYDGFTFIIFLILILLLLGTFAYY